MIRGKSDRGAFPMPDEPANSSAQFLERKLATILSADVAEFSRLMGEDEEQTLRTFRGHKQVFESLVAMHRGRIFNTAGDAILAEFGSAVEAVRCATDIQTALRTRNDQLPPARQVRFRIGVNLGDVMVQGQDLLGDGVNVAARLQTAAEPGGICISGSVHDQIRNKLSLSFQSLGERSYKNIPQPIRTFSVTESEGGGTLPSRKADSGAGSAAKWIAAAVVLLLLGGGYWAYSVNERNKAERAGAMAAPATPTSPPPPAAPKPTGDKLATEQPQPLPANTAPPVAAAAKPTETPHASAPRTPPRRSASAAAATPAAVVSPNDGDYYGPICYAKTPKEPRQCYRQVGTVHGNKITSKWAIGQTGMTMLLAGDISSSGDVKMELHSEKPDGTRVVTIMLQGTLLDGKLDAKGSFLIGRPVTLNWHK
jgi:class 3 adenylate cyclase